MPKVQEEPKKFPARPDKTINWLGESRDGWRHKALSTKSDLKTTKQAQKRARESREEWKDKYKQAETKNRQQESDLAEKMQEIADLHAKCQNLEQEKEALKKKYLSQTANRRLNATPFTEDAFRGVCCFVVPDGAVSDQ